jgi:D-amino-acid dehydrogenase
VKVVVIGGGIVGASAAFHLVDAGADVVVVDDDRPGRATRAGAGIVSSSSRRNSPGDPAFELAARAFAAYPPMVDQLGGAPGLWDEIGELHVAPPGPDLDAVYAGLRARAGSEAGAPDGAGTVQRLDPAATLAAFPYLRLDLASVRVTTTVRVDGEVVRTALIRAAVSRGARLAAGPATLVVGDRRAVGVVAGGRHEEADAVIVAAGAWSADVVRPAGVTLALDAQRGQILHLLLPGVDTSRLPVVHPVGASHYILPFADSRIVVGATRETGAGFDPRLTAGGVAQVLGHALGVAPGLAGATIGEMRVGLRPATPDGDPLLGPVPSCPGLWIATGMGPVGLSIGPYCGRLIARWVLGVEPEMDLTPFAPGRPFS